MGDFLSNISHEFRTPLSALAASIELLLDQLPTLSQEELKELLDSLYLGILGLQTLVDNLLEGASIEAGRFRVHPRPADLQEIIHNVARIMHPLFNKYHQSLALELPEDLPAVQAAPRRTGQVLVNLLSNAIKAGPPGSRVTLTAGAGAEAVQLRVADHGPGITSEQRQYVFTRFANLRGDNPELHYGLPPEVTAMGGLDALTQLIEPFVGRSPQPITDALCLDGMRRIARSLRPAFSEGSNAAARSDLALAALFSGIALANAGLGVVHGFAGVIGGMTEAHHGVVCASLLPAGMLANVTALRARAPDHPSLPRFTCLATALTGREPTEAEDGIAWVAQLARDLGVPPLSQLGLEERDVDLLVERTAVASCTKGNPIVLTPEELKGIVRASW